MGRHGVYRARAEDREGEVPISHYSVGQQVKVHAMGFWYTGEVVKIGRTRAHVRYTSGAGTTRIKAVEPLKIRPHGFPKNPPPTEAQRAHVRGESIPALEE